MLLMAEVENPRKKLHNLRDVRIDAGFFRQEDLAQAAGIDQTLVSQAESGREITRVTATKILFALRARGIQVSIHDIDWVVKPTKPKKK